MLTKNMTDKLNYQINREIYSSYLYLSMSSYAMSIGLTGMANWFNIQIQEELDHAQKFYNYVNDQGERVLLDKIEAPDSDFKSALDLFERTLEHEKFVTGLINDLVSTAREEKDYATENFLQWFVSEQVEEESNDSDIINKLKLIGDNGRGILMIDMELGKRVFTPPVK